MPQETRVSDFRDVNHPTQKTHAKHSSGLRPCETLYLIVILQKQPSINIGLFQLYQFCTSCYS